MNTTNIQTVDCIQHETQGSHPALKSHGGVAHAGHQVKGTGEGSLRLRDSSYRTTRKREPGDAKELGPVWERQVGREAARVLRWWLMQA